MASYSSSCFREATPRAYRAMIVIFCCIILQPDHPDALAHLHAVQEAADFMARTLVLEPKSYVQSAQAIAQELVRISRAAIAKAQPDYALPTNSSQAPLPTPFDSSPMPLTDQLSSPSVNGLLPADNVLDPWEPQYPDQENQAMTDAVFPDFFGFPSDVAGADQWLNMSFTFPWDLPDLQTTTYPNAGFNHHHHQPPAD
ncbi:hypothetical protein CDD82_1549 [Ophiocordyceps australis]|uniref:Uncharacterized protein n=1 Tax=Ophiocordyceps australis TaxID=1399860 RepID=A0A2C5YG43_9HYPO|nr:hypothetical protein CDD82_1549 [Ophiocordyceps australis]